MCDSVACSRQLTVGDEVQRVGGNRNQLVVAVSIIGQKSNLHDIPTVWLGKPDIERLRAVLDTVAIEL